MLPDSRFSKMPLEFWAYVRTISEQRGYTDRSTKQIKTHSIKKIWQLCGQSD